MPLFFKLRKLRFFSENKFGKYLLYALGEVILVVVGILLALQINNLNEESKAEKVLNGVLKTVSYDLEKDTILLNTAIVYYEVRQKNSFAILKGEMSTEEFSQCAECASMTVSYFPVPLNDKGYQQLKTLNEDPRQKDSLVVDIVQFYRFYGDFVDEIGLRVENNSVENFEHWSANYPWFSSIVIGIKDERFIDYVENDQDFKNRVALFYTVACQNYLGVLQMYKANAKIVLERIEERLSEIDL